MYVLLRVAADENVEVGAGRHIVGFPAVVAVGHVCGVKHNGAPAVEDAEVVMRPASAFEADDGVGVVHSVAIGCYEVGEGKRAVAVYHLVAHKEIEMYQAVALVRRRQRI